MSWWYRLRAASVKLVQLTVLYAARWTCYPFVKSDRDLGVVGVQEVANINYHLSNSLDSVFSVNLYRNSFYKNAYSLNLGCLPSSIRFGVRLFVGPAILGYLSCRASRFVYVGEPGFLDSSLDGRNAEFRFLKTRGKQVVTIFCGDDIRSPLLSREDARKRGLDVMSDYIEYVAPWLNTSEHEHRLALLAAAADRHSDVIFSLPVDQISYLRRPVQPFIYFHPDEAFKRNDKKFDDLANIRIVHAPTSPVIKGTQLVRAAIKKLQTLGYSFEYIELSKVPNERVVETLNSAHIVLNQFYAFAPSVLGIEAMACHCAVLTSANADIEPCLPEGANDAWCVTHYWEVFDNLKRLLDNTELIKQYADSGYDWAFTNYRASESRKKFLAAVRETSVKDEAYVPLDVEASLNSAWGAKRL